MRTNLRTYAPHTLTHLLTNLRTYVLTHLLTYLADEAQAMLVMQPAAIEPLVELEDRA